MTGLCDSCNANTIQGKLVHELGCPNEHKIPTECKCCDNVFIPEHRGQPTCSDSCYAEYWGV